MVRKKRGERGQRLKQIRSAYQMTRKVDPKVGLYTALAGLGAFAVVGLLGYLIHPIYIPLLGLPAALLAAAFVFGRRAERAAYSQVEGQLGAAGAILGGLRRGWTVEQGVAATPTRDPRHAAVVHRAVGRAGVVLVAEGPESRARALLAQEKKKHARVLPPEAPVHDFVAGDGEGAIPLRKLQHEVMKLPRTLRPAQVAETERRLKALGTMKLPLPKGPMPRGVKLPKGPQPR